MATNNSGNNKFTNNSDGYDLSGGTTARKLTVTGADMTLTGSGTNVYTFPSATSTLYGTASASITSAQLLASMSDETGTGALVFATSPTLVTPVINGLPTGTGIATANTVSTLVARDGSGNFSAGTITATLTGNASTATALANVRTIGGVSFDGTANIVPQTIQSINEVTDTTCFPLFISASGSQSLQPLNNTSLTFNSNTAVLGSTIFNAGTGFQIGGAASSGKILKANGTNFVASTETYAAPGTSGNIMTSDGTNWTSAAPSAGAFTPYMLASTDFTSSARYNGQNGGGGSLNYSEGVLCDTTTGGGGFAGVRWSPFQNTGAVFSGSPEFTASINVLTIPSSASNGMAFLGLGGMTTPASTQTYTNRAIGFKFLSTGSSQYSLYATQADGTTETASSALTTLVANDSLEISLKVNGTSSVDYYWRKNGGAWSAATNLTTNIPTNNNASTYIQFLLGNQSSGVQNRIILYQSSYKR